MPSSSLKRSFYQRTIQAAQHPAAAAAGCIQPTHFIYRYQVGIGITLATYLRWLKPSQRLYLILDHRSPDDELAKWAHHHLSNVFVMPHYHAGLTHYLLDNIYQGVTPAQPQLPVLLSNLHLQAWHAVGALAFHETDLLLIHALQHGQYYPQAPRVVNVHFQHQLPYNCSLHEVKTRLAALCREVNSTYTCFECSGPGIWSFSVYDRATLSQIALDHQSFCFFPTDILSLAHLNNLPETDHTFALQYAVNADLFQDNLDPAAVYYTMVITLDLALLVPVTITPTGEVYPILRHGPSPPALTPLVCILNLMTCDSELLNGCEVIISAAYHHLKIASNVQAYFIHDQPWIMFYLQSLDAFQELLALGFQFQSRAAVLAQLTPGSVVVHFGFQEALAEAALWQYYTSSVMMVLLSALRGERLIDGEVIIGTSLYKRVLVKKQLHHDGLTVNDLLYYRHWSWLWEKYTRHILFARQCLTQQMFNGLKAWHILPIDQSPTHQALSCLPLPSQPWSLAMPIPVLYAQDLVRCCPKPPVFLLWSKTLSVEMVQARAAFYVTTVYATYLYHHLLLQGSMPLIYDVTKLASKQLCSCVIQINNNIKRMPKRLTLVCTMHDQTVIRIRAKYALQDPQHYAIYLRNLALNF